MTFSGVSLKKATFFVAGLFERIWSLNPLSMHRKNVVLKGKTVQ